MGCKASGIRQQGGHLPSAMMGNPSLLQKRPDVSALLPQGGDDREQTAATQGTFGGLDAMADLAVDHRLPQRTLSGIIGGRDALDFQESPEGFLLFEQLAAGAYRSGPGRFFSLLGAQIHRPLQRLLKGQPNRLTTSTQGGPVDPAAFPLMPLSKQFLLQGKQLGADLRAGATPFGNGRQIADQVGPTELALTDG